MWWWDSRGLVRFFACSTLTFVPDRCVRRAVTGQDGHSSKDSVDTRCAALALTVRQHFPELHDTLNTESSAAGMRLIGKRVQRG